MQAEHFANERNGTTAVPCRNRGWLASYLLGRSGVLLPRFLHFYRRIQHRVQALSRQKRRALCRLAMRRSAATKIASALTGAALLLALSRAPARAANIDVADGEVGVNDNGICSLIEAIENANDTTDGNVHDDCTAGNPAGADSIILPAGGNFTLTGSFVYYLDSGTGLPLISSRITIQGNGTTLSRETADPDQFRLLAVSSSGNLTINDATLSGGDAAPSAYASGGAIYNKGSLALNRSTLSGNSAINNGGGIHNFYGAVTINNSTLNGNSAVVGGGLTNQGGVATINNSTLSDNSAEFGGGATNTASSSTTMTINNSTLSGNSAVRGGGVFNALGMVTFNRSLVSGNSGAYGQEVYIIDAIANADNYNLFGHSGLTDAEAFVGFVPGTSDLNATSDGSNTDLTDILDTTLADNGGPTETHALVAGSLAIDKAPDGDCIAFPVNGRDQRGYARNVDGNSTVSGNECDIGAFEYDSFPAPTVIYMTAAGPDTTDDGVAFGKEDILRWDGSNWSLFFDGSMHGLSNAHDVNAIHVNNSDDLYISFLQNKIGVPDVGRVQGQDVIRFGGSGFEWTFDGSDVGLTTTSERIDGLHILNGSVSPIEEDCEAYLLISTLGSGKVPAYGGGTVNFRGEDVLGFCATHTGMVTAGFWHLVLDGSAEGMPKNSTDSISASGDGETIYLTTEAAFNVDDAFGGHSMVYKFDTTTGEFSGPFFSAPANGLNEKVDGLHVDGDLP